MDVAPHTHLELVAFVARFAGTLELPWVPLALPVLLDIPAPDLGAEDPEIIRGKVRDLLRVGGFKPSGRSKPASEYVQRAIPEGRLGPINAAVDLCNVASFHSGLPISVVDIARVVGGLHVDVAPQGTKFVFNASGQVIDVGGLLCLGDDEGPCANAVKDSQRTKTQPATEQVLYAIWGTHDLPGRAAALARWMRRLLERAGALTQGVYPSG
jgi:DNA/RNA-binding domain of Phe-tRNA-synthetase-like protein